MFEFMGGILMVKKMNLKMTIIIILTIIILGVGFVTKTVIASNKRTQSSKIITSIQIKPGDTLWDIASRYYTDDYDNINFYIEEIKKCNGLSNDMIHEGKYLIIPYYVSES